MPLARARGARQLRVTRGDAGDPGAARTPSSSKENPGLPRLGWVLAKPYASRALWLLCGCSWQAPAGSRRAPEAAQLRAGTAGCVGGCWGGAQGDWHLSSLSPVPVVPGLAGTLQRGRAGADPRPRELFPQETAAVCPHIAPALAQSCAGHGALQRARRSSLGSQILGWLRDGWWMLQAGVALGRGLVASQIQPWESGRGDSPGTLVVNSSGCPPTSAPGQGVPVPHGEQRGPMALSQSPSLGPAPERWLGKSRVWIQGRERSRARSKYFQWFNGLRASWGKAATGMMDAFPGFPGAKLWDKSVALGAADAPAGRCLGRTVRGRRAGPNPP